MYGTNTVLYRRKISLSIFVIFFVNNNSHTLRYQVGYRTIRYSSNEFLFYWKHDNYTKHGLRRMLHKRVKFPPYKFESFRENNPKIIFEKYALCFVFLIIIIFFYYGNAHKKL